MSGLLDRIAKKLAAMVTLSLAAGLFFLVGLGFMTAAAWIALADRYDALAAALILGCGYLALAAIASALLISRGNKRPREGRSLPPKSDALSLVEAFFSGFDAARRKRKNHR